MQTRKIISQKDKEAHIYRMALNFLQVEIPKDYSDLLSKILDYKVMRKCLSLLEITSRVENETENISATYMKNNLMLNV